MNFSPARIQLLSPLRLGEIVEICCRVVKRKSALRDCQFETRSAGPNAVVVISKIAIEHGIDRSDGVDHNPFDQKSVARQVIIEQDPPRLAS